MLFGRGFGFRGWSSPWPYVGLGRGGLPRCWAIPPFWGVPYSYPCGVTQPYGMGVYSHAWETGYPFFNAGYPHGYTPWDSGFGQWWQPYGSPMTVKEEKEWLKSQADAIKQQIDEINDRIIELEKG